MWLRLAVGTGSDRHLQSFLGLLNWHVRPRGLGCPFAAGAYCWLRWGRMVGGVKQPAQGFPLKMLGSLATLVAVAAEPWQAPGGEAWRQLKTLGVRTGFHGPLCGAGVSSSVSMERAMQGAGGWERSCREWVCVRM